MGLTGDKSFGNQYSVNGKADKEFSSLQLVVDDYDAAKVGTDKFLVTVGFGKLLGGNSYTSIHKAMILKRAADILLLKNQIKKR